MRVFHSLTSHSPLHTGGVLLGFSCFTHFMTFLCWSKDLSLIQSWPGGTGLCHCAWPAGSCKGSHQVLQTPVTQRGEQGSSEMLPAPQTCCKSGYYPLHVMQRVPSPHCLAIRTEAADVPVLLLNPPGKGKWIPSSHLVQGSQKPQQAGRAGPKETKLDF